MLTRLAGGGAALIGAGLAGSVIGDSRAAAETPDGPTHAHDHTASGVSGVLSAELPVGTSAGPYGGMFAPPGSLGPDALDHITTPPPAPGGRGGRVIEVEMTVTTRRIEVANGVVYEAWTYNDTAPGPTLRATEGDTLRIHFRNATAHDHNLHFHGRHSPLHDGWEPIRPGGETVYEIVAGPVGLHPYHCHTMPIDQHIAKGLYGALIVDPPGGRPPAHEVMLILGGWDLDGAGSNDVYTWNGIAGYYEKFPIKLPAGDPVRAYVVNMVEYDPVASFHLHAETFDVYPSGMGEAPTFATDVITLGQTDRAMLEFTLSERGRYMFHPHQHSIAHRGAMGWFSAI